MTVIPILVGALGTVPKGLEKTRGNEGQRKNWNLRTVKIGKNTKESGTPEETYCHLNLSEEPSFKTDVKNL